MEIIRLPGYLDFEKVTIAKDYLLPKLVKELGLSRIAVEFDEAALQEIIRHYTRESGVREMERQISNILRQKAVELAEGKKIKSIRITKRKSQLALGAHKFSGTDIKTSPTIGYAVGLAWTEKGGEALPVEVIPMNGSGKLTLTGSLGDVLQESATAALSYIRNHARKFGLDDHFFEKIDLHVHLPEGAVPKDGPSAGVTVLTAMLSALSSIPVRTDVAMTGEITLTGDVLPVGGLNEKLLAAKRLGISTIIVPARNRKDISELKEELLDGLTLHYVRRSQDVLKLALEQMPITTTGSRKKLSSSARASR
jgi:ATP-dependent Lon protease